jgi:hypothetical protein
MALSLKNSSLRGVTISAVLPILFFEDTFDGAAGPLTGHAPTTGYPIPAAYGFGPWTNVTGTPQIDGAGAVLLVGNQSASITSTGAVVYGNNPGGYVITSNFTFDNTDTAYILSGTLPNGIDYIITMADSGYAIDPGTVKVQYGPSLEFTMQTGVITVDDNVAVFLGNTAQSIEVLGNEEATEAETLTFGASNNVNVTIAADSEGTVTIGNIQVDTL